MSSTELPAIHTYTSLKRITRQELFNLFRDLHPRLKVFRETFNEGEITAPNVNVIIIVCPICQQSFRVGDKVFVMPCSQLHVTHTNCFNQYLKSLESRDENPQAEGDVGQRMKLNCIHCRTKVTFYHNLSSANDRYKCLVAIGNLNNSDEKVAFACLEGEERRFKGIRQYFPWNIFCRFISVPMPDRLVTTIPPVYIVKEEERRDSQLRGWCLRTNRERLCEAPSLRFLRRYIAQHGQPAQPVVLLKMLLLADVVNYVHIRNRSFRHIYLQVRVNCGQVAWFGFREYRDYCLRNFGQIVDDEGFLTELDRFSFEYHSNASHLGQLYTKVKKLISFDKRVDQMYPVWLNNPAITNLQTRMEEKYGRRRHIWEDEDQDERRPHWVSDDSDLADVIEISD